MAIFNVSPESFNGDGVRGAAALTARAQAVIAEGADIVDIGGQSTRPGATTITPAEELRRVLPAIAAVRALDKAIPISIDTFKPEVAEAALRAGATIVNDVHGCADPAMVRLLTQHKHVRVVVMHSRGDAQTMSQLTDYPAGVMAELHAFFKLRTAALLAAGIARDRIIIDPGIGFAKTAPQSFTVTRDLQQLTALGFPLLYAGSQKSFIGKALAQGAGEPAPVEDRTVGTHITTAYAMLHGADIVRLHDVRAGVQARTIVESLLHPDQVTT